MAYFIGLDSGGTKTECWLGTETEVLARATAGTVKPTRVGQEVATERLHALLAEVEAVAGVPLAQVSRTCVGICRVFHRCHTAVGRAGDRRASRRRSAKAFRRELDVSGAVMMESAVYANERRALAGSERGWLKAVLLKV